MAHEQQLITKRAWLGPGGPEGYLTVASASLRWQPASTGGTGVQELRIPLASITSAWQRDLCGRAVCFRWQVAVMGLVVVVRG